MSDKLILKLSLLQITSQSYSLLVNLFTQHYPIVELDVRMDHSKKLEFDVIPTLWTQINTLRVLNISGIKIDSKEAECLASCRNILVQDLSMRNCRLSFREANKVAEMLAHNPSIVSVDLRSNDIKDEGVERI